MVRAGIRHHRRAADEEVTRVRRRYPEAAFGLPARLEHRPVEDELDASRRHRGRRGGLIAQRIERRGPGHGARLQRAGVDPDVDQVALEHGQRIAHERHARSLGRRQLAADLAREEALGCVSRCDAQRTRRAGCPHVDEVLVGGAGSEIEAGGPAFTVTGSDRAATVGEDLLADHAERRAAVGRLLRGAFAARLEDEPSLRLEHAALKPVAVGRERRPEANGPTREAVLPAGAQHRPGLRAPQRERRRSATARDGHMTGLDHDRVVTHRPIHDRSADDVEASLRARQWHPGPSGRGRRRQHEERGDRRDGAARSVTHSSWGKDQRQHRPGAPLALHAQPAAKLSYTAAGLPV